MALTSEERLEKLKELKQLRGILQEFQDPVTKALKDRSREDTTLREKVFTGGKTTLDVAAGFAEGFPRSAVAGGAGTITGAVPGGLTATEGVEMVQSKQFFPVTDPGQEALTTFAEWAAPVVQFVTEQSNNPIVHSAVLSALTGVPIKLSSETTQNAGPSLSTGIFTAVFGIPELLGFRTGTVRRLALNKKIKEVEAVAKELGVDLGSPNLPDQIIKTADDTTITVKGEGVADLQNQLRAEKIRVRDEKNRLYEEASGKRAALRPPSAAELDLDVRLALTKQSKRTGERKRFKLESEKMGDVREIIKDFENLSARSKAGEAIEVGEFYDLRRTINDNKPNDGSPPDTALTVMKRELDEFLDEKMFKDFIEGDQTVIEAHRKAIAANKDFKSTFDDDVTIKKIIDAELIQEEVTNLLIGAEKAKVSSGRLVGRVKKILGDDHPAMDGIRQEVLLPIVEPLLRTSPSFRQFSKNVDRLLRNNPTLVKEILPESLEPIINLKKIADAAIKTGVSPGFDIDIATSLSRIMFGHQIAKAALKVSLGAKALDFMKTLTASQKKALMAELLGYNPNKAVIPLSSVVAGGIIADQVNQAIEHERSKE